MKKLIIILSLLLVMTSCEMTHQEKLDKIKECKELWLSYYLHNISNQIKCDEYIIIP